MSQFNIRLSDQNRVKVTSSLKSFNTINSLLNVDVTNLVNGSVLIYNSTTGKWTATTSVSSLNIDGGTYDVPLSTIRLKRSGISTIPSLVAGEIAVNYSQGTWNDYNGRLWIGDGSANPVVIGGRYFAEIADHQPGVLTASSAIIVDSNKYIDHLNVVGIVTASTLYLSGNLQSSGISTSTGGIVAGNIGIASNIISSKSGSNNTIYIDPYPDGLSNDGTVIIKGNLQVDGTTTTVNSSTVTINESIVQIGDVTSIRTVVSPVSAGSTTIPVDSVVGINTGDVLTYISGLPANENLRTVVYYNTSSKIIGITGTISGLSSATQLTITHAYDTQSNRGISFKYNDDSIGLGTTATFTGFFGFQDYNKRFTFVPNATIGVTTSTGYNGYISGEKGYIDIKGLYYQPADISLNGVSYFDSTGLINSTTSPGSGITTSNYILTTQPGTNIPVWTSTIDGGEY